MTERDTHFRKAGGALTDPGSRPPDQSALTQPSTQPSSKTTVKASMAELSELLDQYHDTADELAVKLNQLSIPRWNALPLEVRVALDVLNPDVRDSSDLEMELARYILTLWARTEMRR